MRCGYTRCSLTFEARGTIPINPAFRTLDTAIILTLESVGAVPVSATLRSGYAPIILAFEPIGTVSIAAAFRYGFTPVVHAFKPVPAVLVHPTFGVDATLPLGRTDKAVRTIGISPALNLDTFRIDAAFSRPTIQITSTTRCGCTYTVPTHLISVAILVGSTLAIGLAFPVDTAEAGQTSLVIQTLDTLTVGRADRIGWACRTVSATRNTG